MFIFLLGLLFVIVIPLAEGVLFALLLREVHIRHPLPLGGVIDTPEKRQIRAAKRAAEQAKKQDNDPVKSRIKPDIPVPNIPLVPPPETIATDVPSVPLNEEQIIAPAVNEEQESPPSVINVFDEATHIPDNLPVNEVLDLMVAESPTDIPDDFENRIEESARLDTDIPASIQDINDDMDSDDLDALAAALPRKKIDFTQELDIDSMDSQPISSTAKELFGKNFDFDTLETPSVKLADHTVQDAALSNILLDVLEDDEAGTVQVSSPLSFVVSPQLTDIIMPQTILPAFSDVWVQDAAGVNESPESDPEKFCFTEELPPMFARRKKSS